MSLLFPCFKLPPRLLKEQTSPRKTANIIILIKNFITHIITVNVWVANYFFYSTNLRSYAYVRPHKNKIVDGETEVFSFL